MRRAAHVHHEKELILNIENWVHYEDPTVIEEDIQAQLVLRKQKNNCGESPFL